MASATTIWQLRPGGNDANGGGFDPFTPSVGTDWSKQDSPQYALTGCTTNTFPTNTVLHASAANDMIGNYCQVISGTNFVAGSYRIVSVVPGSSFTVDNGTAANIGITGNASAGVINIGGAHKRLDKANGTTPWTSPGNKVWVLTGTYSNSTTQTIGADGGVSGGLIDIIGHNGTYTDTELTEGSMPILTSGTTSIAVTSLNAANRLRFKNLKFTHSAATRGVGMIGLTTSSSDITIQNCVFDGCLQAISTSNLAIGYRIIGCTIRNSTSTTLAAIVHGSNNQSLYMLNCLVHSNGHAGLSLSGGNAVYFNIKNCVFANNGNDGIKVGSNVPNTPASSVVDSIENCVFFGNTGAGIHFSQAVSAVSFCLLLANNIFSRNTTYGILNDTVNTLDNVLQLSNAFDANTTADRSNIPAGIGDVTLSGNPFTNSTNKDFSLISTGAGLQCRAAAYPAYVGAVTVTDPNLTYRDDGAAQSQASSTSSFRPVGESLL